MIGLTTSPVASGGPRGPLPSPAKVLAPFSQAQLAPPLNDLKKSAPLENQLAPQLNKPTLQGC